MTSYCSIAFSLSTLWNIFMSSDRHNFPFCFSLRSAYASPFFKHHSNSRAIITPKILTSTLQVYSVSCDMYRDADKSLAHQEGITLQRQMILSFIYPIYNYNWRNISTIYIHNKTSIERNILTIKHNTSGSTLG